MCLAAHLARPNTLCKEMGSVAVRMHCVTPEADLAGD